MDWHKLHGAYGSSPTLQARLGLVRTQIAQALDMAPTPRIRLISICAGDGHDVIGTLADHPRRSDTAAYLVEIDPGLVVRGGAALEQHNLQSQVQFLRADATIGATYTGIAPADVLVVCGVFDNVPDAVLEPMVHNLGCLCRPGATMVWTRSTEEGDGDQAITRIRTLLNQTGFHETVMEATTPSGFVVASHTYQGTPGSRIPRGKLFEFTGNDRIRSSRS